MTEKIARGRGESGYSLLQKILEQELQFKRVGTSGPGMDWKDKTTLGKALSSAYSSPMQEEGRQKAFLPAQLSPPTMTQLGSVISVLFFSLLGWFGREGAGHQPPGKSLNRHNGQSAPIWPNKQGPGTYPTEGAGKGRRGRLHGWHAHLAGGGACCSRHVGVARPLAALFGGALPPRGWASGQFKRGFVIKSFV